MTTNVKETPHPFRNNDVKPVCVVCDALAHLRCPRCHRPFCIDHAATASSCEDCERKGGKINLRALLGYTLVVGGLASYVFTTFDPMLGVMAGVLSGLTGGAIAAVRRSRRENYGWQPVEGNALRVSAEAGKERDHRRVGLRGRRSRGGASFQNSIGRFQL